MTTNRHDRRRAAKFMRLERVLMTPEQISTIKSICAWDGCSCTSAKPNDEGWSTLLLYTGETKLEFLDIDPRSMTRDAVLCPEHARHLDGLLKYKGNDLRNVAGSA